VFEKLRRSELNQAADDDNDDDFDDLEDETEAKSKKKKMKPMARVKRNFQGLLAENNETKQEELVDEA
jgi:hypothetical protein